MQMCICFLALSVLNVHVGANLQNEECERKSPPSTWVSVTHVQVVAAADAGGVQRVNAEGGELAAKLLDVAVFTVQRHLKLQTDLVLFRYQLSTTQEQVFNCSSDFSIVCTQPNVLITSLKPVANISVTDVAQSAATKLL